MSNLQPHLESLKSTLSRWEVKCSPHMIQGLKRTSYIVYSQCAIDAIKIVKCFITDNGIDVAGWRFEVSRKPWSEEKLGPLVDNQYEFKSAKKPTKVGQNGEPQKP